MTCASPEGDRERWEQHQRSKAWIAAQPTEDVGESSGEPFGAARSRHPQVAPELPMLEEPV